MSIIIDLVIIGIILICIIAGYIKGLTGSLIKILSFILSIIIAFVLFVPVSNFIINNTKVDESIENSIRETILKENSSTQEENMPNAMTDYINNKVEEMTTQAKQSAVDATAKEISLTVVKAGTWILLFIIARILLITLSFITSLIAKLPVIKQFDKLGGIIYGLIEGLIIIYIALALISFITPMTNGDLSKSINKSYVGQKMYNNNLLLNIIF